MENGECTAVKNRVFTSTNCAFNPTEKYLTGYIKLGLLKNRSQITYFKKKNRDCVCPTEKATNTYIKYFFTVCVNQITFIYGERKKKWPNFNGMFGQNRPISAAFTAILNITLPQCNAIRVCTPSTRVHRCTRT